MNKWLFLVVLVTGVSSSAFAWTGPTATAPSGNTAAPLNTSSATQLKNGILGVGGLAVYGNGFTTGSFGIANSAPSYTLDVSGTMRVTGNAYASGYFHTSDRSLKHAIKDAPGLSSLLQMRGVTFQWNDSGEPSAGVIAQEIEDILPSAVVTSVDGVKMVDYDQLTAVLIQAIKEQQEEIESLRGEIETLKTDR